MTPKLERKLAKYGAAVVSFNLARSSAGMAPSPKTCREGKWLKAINKSGIEHETYVIVDDRKHDKGDMFKYVKAPTDQGTPWFPIMFVLDHNGKVLNKQFVEFTLSGVEALVKQQAEDYDKALKKAKASKKESDKSGSSKSDKKDEE